MQEFQHRYTLIMPPNLDYPWMERILRIMLSGYSRCTQRNDGDMIHLSFDVPLKAGDRKSLIKDGFGVEERP
jgi:hypothetical protein